MSLLALTQSEHSCNGTSNLGSIQKRKWDNGFQCHKPLVKTRLFSWEKRAWGHNTKLFPVRTKAGEKWNKVLCRGKYPSAPVKHTSQSFAHSLIRLMLITSHLVVLELCSRGAQSHITDCRGRAERCVPIREEAKLVTYPKERGKNPRIWQLYFYM